MAAESRFIGRRTWLEAFGGMVALHVIGCARPLDAAVGRSSAPRGAPSGGPGGGADGAAGGPGDHRNPAGGADASSTGTSPPGDGQAPGAGEGPGATRPAAPPKIPELALPPRPEGAETGTQFLRRVEGLGRGATDEEIVKAILSGNVPPYQRCLVPLEARSETGTRAHVARLWVTCDYLAIGSDDDFIRMPMTASAAQRIAEVVDAILPTRKLVDLIYAAAPQKLPPSYIDGGPTEGTLDDYAVHQAKVEKRRAAAGFALGALTAGHKKDLVLSRRLAEQPDRVAIYGWHLREGEVIQSLSIKHSRRYADYSHGVRLVAQTMTLDGEPRRVCDVLEDPGLADLLCDEGPLPFVTYPTTLPAYTPPAAKKSKKKRKKRV